MLLPLMSFFFSYEYVRAFVSFLFFCRLTLHPSPLIFAFSLPLFFFRGFEIFFSGGGRESTAQQGKRGEPHSRLFFFFCISPCLSLILSHSRFLCVAKVREKIPK